MYLKRILMGLVNVILGFVGVMLGLRFILRLFAANPDNTFVDWVYTTSAGILAPFRGIFPDTNLEGFVVEFSALFALLVYGLIGILAFYIIDTLTPEPEPRRREHKEAP